MKPRVRHLIKPPTPLAEAHLQLDFNWPTGIVIPDDKKDDLIQRLYEQTHVPLMGTQFHSGPKHGTIVEVNVEPDELYIHDIESLEGAVTTAMSRALLPSGEIVDDPDDIVISSWIRGKADLPRPFRTMDPVVSVLVTDDFSQGPLTVEPKLRERLDTRVDVSMDRPVFFLHFPGESIRFTHVKQSQDAMADILDVTQRRLTIIVHADKETSSLA